VVEVLYPAKLRRGGEIRVIAPSCSRAMVTEHDHTGIIEGRFAELGLSLSYGAHVDERDAFDSSAVRSRVADLLQGTPYMPSLADAVLIVEDDEESHPANFARNLTSLLQLPDAASIRGLVVGRFQRATNMTRQLLEQIINGQPQLADLPVLANVDVGHTSPMATLPIGGQVVVSAQPGDLHLILAQH
jgi:muramoyltetrapeptide carboxypeptidase LdcA involved in peptidoglycan recycling